MAKKSKKTPKYSKKKTGAHPAKASKGRPFARQVQPNYWRRVKTELHILICTSDKKYAGLRSQIRKHGTTTQVALVSNVASGIALSLGFAAAALVPFVAMALLAFVQMGANAWCAGHS